MTRRTNHPRYDPHTNQFRHFHIDAEKLKPERTVGRTRGCIWAEYLKSSKGCIAELQIIKVLRTHMPEQSVPLTIFHMLEKNVGNQIRVILDPAYGFEGTLMAVTREPAGIWLSDAEAIILRATIAQPIPQVTSREDRSEIFVHLNSVQRIEVLHAPIRR